MTPHEILIAAKALIPDEAHWWQAGGVRVGGCCPIIAIDRAARNEPIDPHVWALEAFKAVIPFPRIDAWNDAPERTYAEVMAAFDAAIAGTAAR